MKNENQPNWIEDASNDPPWNNANEDDDQNEENSSSKYNENLLIYLESDMNNLLHSEINLDNFVRFLRVKDSKTRKERLNIIMEKLHEKIRNKEEFTNSQLRTIVRMAKEVPFSKIRKAFSGVLELLGEKIQGFLNYRVSSWIDQKNIIPITSSKNNITAQSKIFKSAFLLNGRVSHLDKILAWFPGVLEKHLEVMHSLMKMDGPLPFTWRNYIAILAAARFNCEYLVRLQQFEFLLNGGDKEWLELGVLAPSMPKKISALVDLNALLAHSPWKIGKEQISDLLQGGEAWGLGELVHAILIMVQFHCLSGIVFGLRIENEVDFPSDISDNLLCQTNNQELDNNVVINQDLGQKTIDFVQALREDRYRLNDSRESWVNEKDKSSIWTQSENNEKVIPLNEISLKTFQCYKGDSKIYYQDFEVAKYNFFRSTDFNWSKDTYGQLSRYHKDLAPLLDSEFNLVKTMTDFTFSDTDGVDTSAFREAIWQYAQRLQGVFDDSYNYHEVNLLLVKELKLFIKKVVCIPESITILDFENIGYKFRYDEKLHITLLASESRKQSILTYAFIAIKNFRSN